MTTGLNGAGLEGRLGSLSRVRMPRARCRGEKGGIGCVYVVPARATESQWGIDWVRRDCALMWTLWALASRMEVDCNVDGRGRWESAS